LKEVKFIEAGTGHWPNPSNGEDEEEKTATRFDIILYTSSVRHWK
jgi:hypothetical protein